MNFWKNITCDNNILEIVSGAKIEFNRPINQRTPLKAINCSFSDKQKIDIEIANYSKLGIIEKADHSLDEFVGQIFPTPKKSGGLRIILNLKPLNIDVQYQHFKMENFSTVLNLIEENCYMSSIDLKDAYYSVNIHESFRKYLRFIWNNQLYQFTCLPNGLSSAPRLYTKLMKPIFSLLRNRGLISVYYLDDSWLMGKTEDECKTNVSVTRDLLVSSGFLINEKKSQFEPSQCIQFLGFNLNSVNMTVTLPIDKKNKIIDLCKTLLENRNFRIRFVAHVIGVLVSSLPGVRYGALFYKFLEKDKNNALRIAKGNYDNHMFIGADAKSELQWWLDNCYNSFKPIRIDPPSHILTTDASLLGWGAVYNENSTGGQWNDEETLLHINLLELKAILFGLQSFLSHLSNTHVRIRSDNATAVAYINNLGGISSIPCHKISKSIWLWAIDKCIHLSAEHLPGSHNVLADKASRIFSNNTEWSLASDVFSRIVQFHGPFSIDLFASRLNTKLSVYSSWKPDPEALFVDAFSWLWSKFDKFYAFPPFSVLTMCLNKICVERARGTLIVPLWPTQPWYPKLLTMLVSPPILLPKNILHLPFKSPVVHNQQKTLQLIACQISGITSESEVFQKSQLISCAQTI